MRLVPPKVPRMTSHLKKRILVQDSGGSGFQTAGIRLYGEDLKPGSNKDIVIKFIPMDPMRLLKCTNMVG
jgi:hypothetical protein